MCHTKILHEPHPSKNALIVLVEHRLRPCMVALVGRKIVDVQEADLHRDAARHPKARGLVAK